MNSIKIWANGSILHVLAKKQHQMKPYVQRNGYFKSIHGMHKL